jgi:hypothetical protein
MDSIIENLTKAPENQEKTIHDLKAVEAVLYKRIAELGP